jgi:hypothetical protein
MNALQYSKKNTKKMSVGIVVLRSSGCGSWSIFGGRPSAVALEFRPSSVGGRL